VTVHRGERDPDPGSRIGDAVHDDGTELERLPFDGIASGDLLRGVAVDSVVMR
jgi:hypothetical protein